MGQYGNVVFIVWRESIEALLVIGILQAWLGQQGSDAASRGRVYLWAGVATGLVAAALLGAAMIFFGDQLDDDRQQMFQTLLMVLAAGLIVQMVLWMRRHGRTLKRDLETALQRAADNANWWGVFTLAAVAVAREGCETVVFLAGTLSAARNGALAATSLAAAAGFGLAVATYGLLQVGSKILSWRLFFRVTEILLLLLAGALLLTAADNLVALGLLPRLSGRLWDASGLLSDGGALGGLLSSLTGWRARPDLTEIFVFLAYWGAMAWLLFRPTTHTR
ncbi:FTR1 family iron permease [Rhodoblastus sp.]|uniref:FTR1 family iron permease n=1 Tax=Rhodoblastus sp. TaxID=1962975 RepID=UPI003F95F66E